MVKVRNVSAISLSVDIVNPETKVKAQVVIQPKGGVTLPHGYVVDSNYYVRHKQALRVISKD